MVVCFVGRTIDHHCLNLIFIMKYQNNSTTDHGTRKKINKKITYTLGLPPTMPVKPGAIKKGNNSWDGKIRYL